MTLVIFVLLLVIANVFLEQYNPIEFIRFRKLTLHE